MCKCMNASEVAHVVCELVDEQRVSKCVLCIKGGMYTIYELMRGRHRQDHRHHCARTVM